MNILVVGNGFDLAHGLPTRYIDFLEFYKKTNKIYTLDETIRIEDFVQDYIWEWTIDENVKRKLVCAFDDRIFEEKYNWKMHNVVTTSNKLLDELYMNVKNNVWVEYFLRCYSYVGENWIDFESEISKIIQILDEIRLMGNNDISVIEIQNEKKEIIMALLEVAGNTLQDTFKNIREIDNYINFLSLELDKLIRALEIYISEFVNEINVNMINMDILNIKPDFVLSFNYSNTYERIYHAENKIEYCYIHGKAYANGNFENCNLVLGIDEYLSGDRKDNDIEFLMFKKYYQRIYKQTGSKYKDWVDDIKKEYEKFLKTKASRAKKNVETELSQHNLYIFGHSLDVTDKDILHDLILNDNVYTTIFYPDKKELGRKIANLVKVIGQDELIRRTGGSTKTIEFKLQQPMVPIED